jgi:hypothetical protein
MQVEVNSGRAIIRFLFIHIPTIVVIVLQMSR